MNELVLAVAAFEMKLTTQQVGSKVQAAVWPHLLPSLQGFIKKKTIHGAWPYMSEIEANQKGQEGQVERTLFK